MNATAVKRNRAESASAALGPLGHLFASPATARVLELLANQPDARFSLGTIQTKTGGAKGTVQAALRALVLAQLVHREGRGARTTYRYAMDRELARQMRLVVQVSRGRATPSSSPLPWLDRLVREMPRVPIPNPYGSRVDEPPSEAAAEGVLAAADPIEGSDQPRSRPGLVTRR